MSSDERPRLDVELAHRHFSAECFNRAWTLIEKAERTAEETEAMVLCALASLWHWTQRADGTERNLSIGHWQVSRVYALAGEGENAMKHARRALQLSGGSPAFYVGYAHEAVARAAGVLGEEAAKAEHLRAAWRCVAEVEAGEERGWLETDLRGLEGASGA